MLCGSVLRGQPGTGRYPEPLGWKPHHLKQGDGRGGWKLIPAEFRFVHRMTGRYVFPFGITYMDNGELLLVASWHDGLTNDSRKSEKPVVAFSKDLGDTWSEFQVIEGGAGRPVGLTDLGKGRLFFQTDLTGTVYQFFTSDYGRTWPERQPLQPASNRQPFGVEGNLLVERDAGGRVTRVGQSATTTPRERSSPSTRRTESCAGRPMAAKRGATSPCRTCGSGTTRRAAGSTSAG
ncbi:MAG: hypothetical protein ACKV22_07290 [Bryobacteraceae bacterium]